jgi:hypothetical protein
MTSSRVVAVFRRPELIYAISVHAVFVIWETLAL